MRDNWSDSLGFRSLSDIGECVILNNIVIKYQFYLVNILQFEALIIFFEKKVACHGHSKHFKAIDNFVVYILLTTSDCSNHADSYS